MKITSEHVKRFVDNYHEQSGVILSTEDVLFTGDLCRNRTGKGSTET
jgi:hypothetical protein